jgi:hypothetical protein
MFIHLYFVLTISYLQIKSCNVLNYNNCSTDWSLHRGQYNNTGSTHLTNRKLLLKEITTSEADVLIEKKHNNVTGLKRLIGPPSGYLHSNLRK